MLMGTLDGPFASLEKCLGLTATTIGKTTSLPSLSDVVLSECSLWSALLELNPSTCPTRLQQGEGP